MATNNTQDDLGDESSKTRPFKDSDSVLSEDTISSAPQEFEEIDHDFRPPITKTMTGKSSVVPRSKRRGMLGQLGFVPEIENPKEYSYIIKNSITLLVAAGGAAAPIASTILFRELKLLCIT